MEVDCLDSRASTGKKNINESAALRLIAEFKSFRRTISCVCGAFHPHLFCPFRATDVRVGRLPRAALGGCAASLCPGLTCFAPSGHGRSLALGRFLRGMAGPLGTRPTRSDGPHAPKGHDKAANRTCSRSLRNGWKWNASIRGALTGKTNANESVTFRMIPAIISFQPTISCDCGAFHPHLFRPFRATDVRGWPLTQGGAR
ncbi:MAG: hypothetical protein RLY70_2281, partial [Planctomycetota bacterium]